jgi:hypothetical protein
MSSDIKIYSIKNFLRKNESGHLSEERVTEIINEIVSAAMIHPDHNVLLDFRETELSNVSMVDILKTAMEVGKFKKVLKNKIANVIPDNEDRISIAKRTEAAIQLKGIDYKFFIDFEEAIDWLSEISGRDE